MIQDEGYPRKITTAKVDLIGAPLEGVLTPPPNPAFGNTKCAAFSKYFTPPRG
jgi:hypothetical protein